MPVETDILGGQRRFPKTEWDLIQPIPSLQSIDVLVRRYWKPLYFYVRRHQFDVETSKDIVQDFLANVLSHGAFSRADPKLGRFRTFILTALSNFIKDWTRTASRLKRGGGRKPTSLDFTSVESDYTRQIADVERETPEKALNRAWAKSLLEQALEQLRGAPSHLKAFRLYLEGVPYESIAQATELSLTAAKVAVHRLRGRLRGILIGRISETVGTEADLSAEISEFIDLLS